jgi:protein-disulfide isomerase
MSKGFWAIIAIIVVGLGGIFFATNHNSGSTSSAPPTNHIEGSASTGVKLVEYGDYECPYCGQFYPIVKQVVAQYKDKIQYQFRNLPLTQIHKNAFSAARAAEAAALQGKFWEMHDLLYQNQDPNGASGWVASDNPLTQYFNGYAKQLGLNVSKFDTDFASSAVNDKINADINAFKQTGLEEATPTFILDGKQIHPGYDVADFQKAIDAEIKAKTGQ